MDAVPLAAVMSWNISAAILRLLFIIIIRIALPYKRNKKIVSGTEALLFCVRTKKAAGYSPAAKACFSFGMGKADQPHGFRVFLWFPIQAEPVFSIPL